MSITDSNVENLYIFNGQKIESDSDSSGKYRQKDERIDITGEYNFHSPLSVQLEFQGIEGQVEAMKSYRTMFIAGDDYILLHEAVSAISNQFEIGFSNLRAYDRSTLQSATANKQVGEGRDSQEQTSLSSLLKTIEFVENNSIIITDLTSHDTLENSRDFLSDFKNTEVHNNFFARANQKLADHNIYWLILVPSEIFLQHKLEKLSERKLAVWFPPFLETLINSFKLVVDLDELNRQISSELWGGESEYLSNLLEAVQNGDFVDTFQLHCNNKLSEESAVNPFISLLENGSECHKIYEAICFILVHTNKQSPHVFNLLLQMILDGEFVTINKTNPTFVNKSKEPITNEEFHDAEDAGVERLELKIEDLSNISIVSQKKSAGEKPRVKVVNPATSNDKEEVETEQHYAFSYWNNNIGRICKAIGITTSNATSKGDYSQYMVPAEHWYRKQYKDALVVNNPIYFSVMFEKIRSSTFIFFDDNDDLANAIFDLFRQQISLQPRAFGAGWLQHYLFDAVKTFKDGLAQYADEKAEQVEVTEAEGEEGQLELHSGNLEQVLEEFVQVKNRHYQLFVYRWTGLLMTLLEGNRHGDIVNEFLDKLIEWGKTNGDIAIFVFEFVKRLRWKPDFDYILWLKKIVSTIKNEEIQKEATYQLSSYLKSKILTQSSLVDYLDDWLLSENTNHPKSLKSAALLVALRINGDIFNRKIFCDDSKKNTMFPVLEDVESVRIYPFTETLLDVMTAPILKEQDTNFINRLYFYSKAIFGHAIVMDDNNKPIPVSLKIVDHVFHKNLDMENYLTLYIIAWSRYLEINKNENGRNAMSTVLSLILDRLKDKPESIKLIRYYLKTIRGKGLEEKYRVETRQQRKQLTSVTLALKTTLSLIRDTVKR